VYICFVFASATHIESREVTVMSTALSCMYYDKTKCTFLFNVYFIWFVYFLALLQPLAINGRDQRNRILANGHIVHHHLSSTLPPASSLQSLSPLAAAVGNVTLTTPSTATTEQQSINSEFDEKDKLKNDLLQLKNELQKSKETIARLQKSEEQMRER
jgi:hypothetical protein